MLGPGLVLAVVGMYIVAILDVYGSVALLMHTDIGRSLLLLGHGANVATILI